MSTTLSDFAANFSSCWVCGRPKWAGMQIHHVARGAHRAKSREKECSLIRCCQACHDELDGLCLVTQYAIIAINNIAAYDRINLNLLRSRAIDAIDEKEVLAEVVRLMNSKLSTGRYALRAGVFNAH